MRQIGHDHRNRPTQRVDCPEVPPVKFRQVGQPDPVHQRGVERRKFSLPEFRLFGFQSSIPVVIREWLEFAALRPQVLLRNLFEFAAVEGNIIHAVQSVAYFVGWPPHDA